MADRDQNVMEMVEKEIKKNPDVSTKELYRKATEVSEKMKELSLRQFNARYPLQVKRQMAPEKPKTQRRRTRRSESARSSTSSTGDVNREAVRSVLLALAKDVTAAEDRAAVVDVLAGIDDYVDQVTKAVRG